MEQEACKVHVALRIRPLLPKESAVTCISLSQTNANETILGGNRSFSFDKAFDHNATQLEVYEGCVIELLQGFFNGYNATILAYGQTGSGKTFTMGSSNVFNVNEEELGIIPRVIKAIFQEIDAKKTKTECLLKVSFLEIYNEEIIDLLDTKSIPSNKLRRKDNNNSNNSISIREEKDGSIGLYGLIEEKVNSYEEMLSCLERGSLSRSTSSTLMNEASSRSHAIFSITLEQHFIEDLYKTSDNTKPSSSSKDLETVNENATPEFIIAKFHFVDLAGSERIKKTGATGSTLKEGININKGLLCLGNVIAALTEKTGSNHQHIPYRDSKLTRILQDSLGGNARTFMIACVSPAESNYDETLNTLKYASRARNIKNKPKINTDPNSAMVNQLKQQIFELKEEALRYRLIIKKHIGEQELQNMGIEMNKDAVGSEKPQFLQEDSVEMKEMRIRVLRLEKDVSRLESEKHILRKELNSKEMESFTVQRERDLLKLRWEKSKEILEENKIDIVDIQREDKTTTKLLEEYNATIARLTNDLKDKEITIKEMQAEYEKILGDSTRDQQLLLQKTEEISLLKREIMQFKGISQNLEEFPEYPPWDLKRQDSISNPEAGNTEENQAKDMLSLNKTTEKQLVLVDETLKMKEELLQKMSEGHTYLEQSLIEEMRHQYHQKIELLQQEIRSLEKEREATVNKPDNSSVSQEKAKYLTLNKQKLQELEAQVKDFRKKEKMQSNLMKQVASQKTQLEHLADEIKAMKKQKIQLMRKLKEDTEAFARWKSSQEKKLNDLIRKNQEKDVVIQKLRSENQKTHKKPSNSIHQAGNFFAPRRSLRRNSSFNEESGVVSLRNSLIAGLNAMKISIKSQRDLEKETRELSAVETELEELYKRRASLVVELEKLNFEKNKAISFDLEESSLVESKENELSSQIREANSTVESLEEKLLFRKRRIEEKTKGNPQKNESKIKDLDTILEETFAKLKPAIVHEPYKDVVKAFYEIYSEIYEQFLQEKETCEALSLENMEIKKKGESLEQMFKVSQAQYELNITRITAEYEEKCLFLIKQQNESLMNSTENKDEGTIKARSESIGENEKKKGGFHAVIALLKKANEELNEKNLKLERNLADVSKKQQNSDKLIQILKRKLEIVTEKYDQMKKQFSKEKYIGLPSNHKTSENNSFGDLSGLLDSPTKTPRKEILKQPAAFSLVSLKERRDMKKNMTSNNNNINNTNSLNSGNNTNTPSQNTNEYLLEKNDGFNEELEEIQERSRAESFVKANSMSSGQKKFGGSFHYSKNSSGIIQSARSNFSNNKENNGNNKHGVNIVPKRKLNNDLNSSFDLNRELITNNTGQFSSLILSTNNDFLLNPDDAIMENSVYSNNEWTVKSNIEAHSGPVYSVCSFGNVLYTSSNKCFKVWSLDTMKTISEIHAHPSSIKSMLLWPEKNVLFTVCEKIISMWDVITMKHIVALKAHKDDIRCLHIYNNLLFSGGKGSITSGALFAWDLRTPNFVEEKEKNQDIFSLLGVGSVLYYGSRNHQVCRLNLDNSLEHLSPFDPPHFDAVSCLNYFKDNLVSGSRDKNIKLWTLERNYNNNVHMAYAHQDWINVLEKNRTETMLFSGSRDGLIKVWGIHENKLRCLNDLNHHTQSVNSICNLDEGYENMIATASSDKTVKIWKGTEIKTISE